VDAREVQCGQQRRGEDVRLLAIDFGTSNTVAALLIDGQAPRTVNFDTSPMLPSAVYYSVDGRLTVGREAQRLARLDPTRFEPNPKRRVDDGEMLLVLQS
jgi:molecular chaperone DnaK (HSP70)